MNTYHQGCVDQTMEIFTCKNVPNDYQHVRHLDELKPAEIGAWLTFKDSSLCLMMEPMGRVRSPMMRITTKDLRTEPVCWLCGGNFILPHMPGPGPCACYYVPCTRNCDHGAVMGARMSFGSA